MNAHQTTLWIVAGQSLLGRYRLLGKIGEGRMADVWRAEDLLVGGQSVAIKVPHREFQDERSVELLKREAARLKALSHPHIVQLREFWRDPARANVAFLVMQLIEGRTLDKYVSDYPEGMPLDMVLPWAVQIADAIDSAGRKGIDHRDIKPANIILEDSTFKAHLLDFGLARQARDSASARQTLLEQRETSGSAGYMSPQQLKGESHSSNDVYSFAVTLYELLGGRLPFFEGDILTQVKHAAPMPLQGLPECVNETLLAAMSKDTAPRPASCAELVERCKDGVWDPGGGFCSASLREKRSCAATGDPQAQHELSRQYRFWSSESPTHRRDADGWLLMAAMRGGVEAQCELAASIGEGTWRTSDPRLAVEWWQRAADQGHEDAQYRLAECYRAADGVPRDEGLAVHWYRKAAEASHEEAVLRLGEMYLGGEGGLPKDVLAALEWIVAAAELGSQGARARLVRLAEQSDGLPAFLRGQLYEHGFLDRNLKRATELYREGAKAGDACSLTALGDMLLIESWGNPDRMQLESKAAELYRQGVLAGVADAVAKLGRMYEYGLGGLAQDDTKAAELYGIGARAGVATAMIELGRMYEYGLGGLAQDASQAVDWYLKGFRSLKWYDDAVECPALFEHLNGLTDPEAEMVERYLWAQSDPWSRDASVLRTLGLGYRTPISTERQHLNGGW